MLPVLLSRQIHQVVSRVFGGVIVGDASVVAEIWDAKEEMWEEMENYSVEMGKGAWSGLMEYVLVGFYVIVLFQLWFEIVNSLRLEAVIPSSQHPETENIQSIVPCLHHWQKLLVILFKAFPL
jgi:hypothetical protein